MPPLMQRIERTVLEDKKRAKNRTREHAHHGWVVMRDDCGPRIVLMNCPCGWIGWMPKEGV